jgi:hypothetical protein
MLYSGDTSAHSIIGKACKLVVNSINISIPLMFRQSVGSVSIQNKKFLCEFSVSIKMVDDATNIPKIATMSIIGSIK